MAAQKAAEEERARGVPAAPTPAASPLDTAPLAAGAALPPAAPVTLPAKGKASFWERMNGGGAGAAPEGSALPAAPPALPAAALGPVYTAPDGASFTDKQAYRQYLFTTFYTFANRRGETLSKAPGEVAGQPFNLEDLTDCTVRLCDWSDTVQADRLTRCRVLISASCESVFLRNCTECVITVACKQLRTRDCMNCTVYLYSKTEPVIEASGGMVFAPFNGAYPGLDGHMRSAALDPTRNLWDRIFDFSKDTDTPALPLPHWSKQGEGGWEAWAITDLPGMSGPPVNPVPRLASAGVEEGGGGGRMLSFDIRAGMAAGQAALRAQEEGEEGEGADDDAPL